MADVFTYEDLLELLRVEKASAELQEINPILIDKLREYFKEKEEFLKQQSESNGFFNSKTKFNTQREIDNAKRALLDLYQSRERKIINRALFCVRTDSKLRDTTNLLKNEEELYKKLLDLFCSNKDSFFREFDPDMKSVQPVPIQNEEDIEKPKLLKEEQKEITIKLRTMEDVPELYDSQLRRYGPFEKDAETELPEELANILIKNKQAVVIKDEDTKANEKVLSALQEDDITKDKPIQDQTETKDKEKGSQMGS